MRGRGRRGGQQGASSNYREQTQGVSHSSSHISASTAAVLHEISVIAVWE